MSVIHMNTFHTRDTFPCFFGFRNTKDTEIARVENHINGVLQQLRCIGNVAIIVTQRFERDLRDDSNNECGKGRNRLYFRHSSFPV